MPTVNIYGKRGVCVCCVHNGSLERVSFLGFVAGMAVEMLLF